MSLPGLHPLDVATPEGRAASSISSAHKQIARTLPGGAAKYPVGSAAVTSFDIPVDSTVDSMWIIEWELLVVYNGTVYIRPNGSTTACSEIRMEPAVQTGPVVTGGTAAGSTTAQGIRILNNPSGVIAGSTYATGRVQMPTTPRANGERPVMFDTSWEQTVASANQLAGRIVASTRLPAYGQITFLRFICDQASGLQAGNVWITRQ